MMLKKTTLLIDFRPSDFLEAPFQNSFTNYSIFLEQGLAKVTLATPSDPVTKSLQTEILNRIRAILNAMMLVRHRLFELGELKIEQEYSDGTIQTNHILLALSSEIKLESFAPDILIKDANGNVMRDTKAERIEEQKKLMAKFATLLDNNPLLNKLIASYNSAVKDKDDELVHLYEIIDALKKHYKSKETAINKLSLSETKWIDCMSFPITYH